MRKLGAGGEDEEEKKKRMTFSRHYPVVRATK